MKDSTKSALRSLAIFAFAFVGYCVGCAAFLVLKFAPDKGVDTYWALKKQGIPIVAARRIPKPVGHFCVFADNDSAMWTIPSGPPAYIFDPSGNLVDYVLDVGDSSKFQDDYGVYSGEELSISELEEIFSSEP